MPIVEAPQNERPLSVIDLGEVDQLARPALWNNAVRDFFPGLSVTMRAELPAGGRIGRIDMGWGTLYRVSTAAALVSFDPRATERDRHCFSLMVQVTGMTLAFQRNHRCELHPGDACLMDEGSPFRLEEENGGEFLFLRMPRPAVLSRYPRADRLVATRMGVDDPGTALLSATLVEAMRVATDFSDAQRSALMSAMIDLLGVAAPFSASDGNEHWRVRRALDYIELNLAAAELTPHAVAEAQQISRRRLDQLFRVELGETVAGRIWTRRLQRAAGDLRDPRRTDAAIAQIAFANGFEDAAHFTRAFKRRYGQTPGGWRKG